MSKKQIKYLKTDKYIIGTLEITSGNSFTASNAIDAEAMSKKMIKREIEYSVYDFLKTSEVLHSRAQELAFELSLVLSARDKTELIFNVIKNVLGISYNPEEDIVDNPKPDSSRLFVE